MLAPIRHSQLNKILSFLCQLLEEAAGRASAARAGNNLRREVPHPESLQDLARKFDFRCTRLARFRCQRNTDRISDIFQQEHGEGRGCGNRTFEPHSGFGQPQMQRISTASLELAVNRDQIFDAAHFRRDGHLRRFHAELNRSIRVLNSASY